MELAIAIASEGALDLNVLSSVIESGSTMNNFKFTSRRKRKRNEDYFEVIVPQYHDDLFAEHFRMSRTAFEGLVNIIGNSLVGEKDLPICLSKKVMFAVWILSKPESFLAAGDRFGIPKSSGHGIFKQIVDILASLLPQYIKWPEESTYEHIAGVFQKRSRGFPGVIGAIDGCHIPCKQPVNNANDYYNRKGFHSIILQGTCDHTGKFTDCFIGLPGRLHDSRVFRNSALFKKITDTNSLMSKKYHLIGDSAYPLSINMMTPFRDNGHLNSAQITYNIKLSSIRSVIERTFGLLKGKFRRLKYLDISDFLLGNKIIAACCVLHNFLISNNEININDTETEIETEVDANVEVYSENTSLNRLAEEKRNHIASAL